MDEYNFLGDLLNKYSQFTPWVQTIIGLGFFAVILGAFYCIKESIANVMQPFTRSSPSIDSENQSEWKDKYYRD